MYKVIANFVDLRDDNHVYKAGDIFPRDGAKVSEQRLNQLLSCTNRRKTPLIEEVKEPKAVVESDVDFMNPPTYVGDVEINDSEVKPTRKNRKK